MIYGIECFYRMGGATEISRTFYRDRTERDQAYLIKLNTKDHWCGHGWCFSVKKFDITTNEEDGE